MIHHSRLRHNLVRWLVVYLCGRKASRLYQQHHLPSRHVRAGVPQGSTISSALFNHFVSDCAIPDLDMTSYADDFTLLASAPRIVEAEARANQLLWWGGQMASNSPLLPRNPVWRCSPLKTLMITTSCQKITTKISLGNRAYRIQHTQIMIKVLLLS